MELEIDQACNSLHPLSVVLTVISIGLSEALITMETSIGILNSNAATGKSRVVSNIIGRTVFAGRFLVGTKAQIVQFINTLVAAIADSTELVW